MKDNMVENRSKKLLFFFVEKETPEEKLRIIG